MHEPPATKAGCTRNVRCRPQDEDTPSVPFPDPFARCAPTFQKGDRETPFSPHETTAARKQDESVCCYVEWKDCRRVIHIQEGRALRIAGNIHISRARRATGAAVFPIPGRAKRANGIAAPRLPRSAKTRALLADHWLRTGAAEHASIAAFSRVSLELIALGAPSTLVAACHRAALDEVRHATTAYAFASAYAGEPLEPSGLPEASLPMTPDLRRLARETLLDGCVGETAAALVAARETDACEDPVIERALASIERDEARHAELAFRILAWALSRGGPALARVINDDLSAAERDVSSVRTSASTARNPVRTRGEALRKHGVLSSAGRQHLAAEALHVVIPVVRALTHSMRGE
jgi:hypothetical protein